MIKFLIWIAWSILWKVTRTTVKFTSHIKNKVSNWFIEIYLLNYIVSNNSNALIYFIYLDQEGADTNFINKNLKTDKEPINIEDSEEDEILEESDIVIGQDEKEQRNNSSQQNKPHSQPHESIVTFIETNRDQNSKEEVRNKY